MNISTTRIIDTLNKTKLANGVCILQIPRYSAFSHTISLHSPNSEVFCFLSHNLSPTLSLSASLSFLLYNKIYKYIYIYIYIYTSLSLSFSMSLSQLLPPSVCLFQSLSISRLHIHACRHTGTLAKSDAPTHGHKHTHSVCLYRISPLWSSCSILFSTPASMS